MPDEPFLRSISLSQDARHPERVAHFRPTAKCASLIGKLYGDQSDRVHFVVAPYGSGKSLACTYLLHLVENQQTPQARALLKTVGDRLQQVAPELGKLARNRAKSNRKGLVVVLEGGAASVAESLQDAAVEAMRRNKLGRQARSVEDFDITRPGAIPSLVALLAEKARATGVDRVLILWDEFGRHLEALVSSGRAAELADVQILAEAVSRIAQIPMSFGVVMHRGFANYAGALPQSAQAEWRKVEGRFSPIQYVDDSIELYELLGGIVTSLRAGTPPSRDWPKVAKDAKDGGLFAQFPEQRLAALLEATWPLDPIVVYLLPRLAARTAQNERTMFGFLYAGSLDAPCGPDALYEYFAPAMELDRGLGGTYRTWLETESASAKAHNRLEITLLRLTSLLTMALSEERGRLTPRLLERAATLGAFRRAPVKAAIKELLARKLLLHRRHADQISLWHGTDLDLRGRMEVERGKVQGSFSLVDFLTAEFPPPIWKPVVYNDRAAMRRFFSSRFVAASELRRELAALSAKGGLPPEVDGEIWYVLSTSATDLESAMAALREFPTEERLLVVVPRTPSNLAEPAIDLVALQRLAMDEDLVADDPLALTEIAQMTDDVHKHLGALVDQLVLPYSSGTQWLHQGQALDIADSRTLRVELSAIAERVFWATPRINSEMINRRQPSATIVNARKKVCLGILERYGQEKLGLEGEFADSAIFRSVLLATGLYRRTEAEGGWRFARPGELEDQKLAAIWRHFEVFLTTPARSPKPFSQLFDHLKRPPIGLRAGLFPVLLAAALKAFPSARSLLRRDGSYIADLLPSEIEAICKEPQGYLIFVPELSSDVRELLEGLHELFTGESLSADGDDSLLGETHDAVADWIHSLPRGALSSRLVSKPCRKFQRALRVSNDPQRLLLREIPALGGSPLDVATTLSRVRECKAELEHLADTYRAEVAKLVMRELGGILPGQAPTILSAIEAWVEAIPTDLHSTVRSPDARNFLRTVTTAFTSADVAAERVAVACTGRTFQHWSDETLDECRERFVQNLEAIESEIIESSDGHAESVRSFILRSRIRRLTGALAEEIGSRATSDYLDSLLDHAVNDSGSRYGNHARSARNAS